mmetsp:Transcript_106926/g.268856  ORF Transcript_106926/g.268856 Transcript_106926/m.268856 type:complete len:353 (+) Transcript_106926:79-1137(+)
MEIAGAKLYVMLDADAWFEPLRQELLRIGIAYEIWNLTERVVNLCDIPPDGIFFNRVSASCHARGHREIAEYGRQVVLWLLAHGRRVLNGGCPAGAAIDFELSKAKQMHTLTLAGMQVPETFALPVPVLTWSGGEVSYAFPADSGTCPASEALVRSLQRLADVIEGFKGAVVVKPNCGGRGLGVTKVSDNEGCVKSLREVAVGGSLPEWVSEAWPIDGVLVVQRLIQPVEPAFITRVEVIGGRLGYAQKTDISDGATHLCTADACAIGKQRFTWRREIDEQTPITQQCLKFASQHGLDVAGFEFIEEAGTGLQFVYDINPNTNYSSAVQKESGNNLYAQVAALCRDELEKLR